MTLLEELRPVRAPRGRHRRRAVWIPALVLLTTLGAGLGYRASYQPLARGGLFGGDLERLTDGIDTTGVKVTEARGGAYTLSIRNEGHFGVTVVGAGTDSEDDLQIKPVGYRREAAGQVDRPFSAFSLRPGDGVDLTLDAQLRHCAPNNLMTVTEIRVRYRFLGHERDQRLPLEVPIKAVCDR